ncbi:pentatricopeptide repeat-containing protein At5g48910-like [Telopea speciosissima]|uniref:pentatricopeptide repeat-containing protein At5g48910-like n=1 Tax=Telopea speciosissima TaxID=54955 RepID=UPI001CC68025|nr:pentatricopeptide repeat-containing protein At5g48910-like [Telopea speciosissima]
MTTTMATEPNSCHLVPNDISSKLTQKTLSTLLNTNCSTSLQHLKQTHAQIIKNGFSQDSYVAGSLVKCYANPHFGSLDCALKIFDQVPQPHTFLWNSMIKGYLENHAPDKAITLYCEMVVADSRPNKFTFPTLFKACAVAKAVEGGMQFHAHALKHGLHKGDAHIRSSGIQMYATCGRVVDARKMLDEGARESDVVCWNAMINGYFKSGDMEAASGLFESMPERNIDSWNAMITGYGRCGMIDAAKQMFDVMPQRNEISWSAMIDGCIEGGGFKDALMVFHQMQKEGIQPRKFVLSSVLAACANVGALDQGRWIDAYIRRNSIRLDAVLGTSLVDMYAKCGRLDLAWEVFEKMKYKEVFSWNAMIGGLAIHGRADDAIELILKMQREKFRPDSITFLGVLNACAHAGLVDEGLSYFTSMKQAYGIEPTVEHYGCAVDLLGRSGHLLEAEDLIKSMPMKPNAAVWGALLGACRIHGNLELGERVGKLLLELEPQNSGRYALLSNIYAKAGRWNDVTKVRKKMKEKGLKTIPGGSLIDLDGEIHEFIMGDGSHPQMKKINSMLKEMITRIQLEEDYKPETSQVLFDIDEEEKETTLCYHSEKLAIAFGLLNTSTGATIRIVKNLRVCEDCHSMTKLVSRVYKREIIVRDRVRFHKFKNGICSCKDFW